MLSELTFEEKEIMFMLIQGQNFNEISTYMSIDYKKYKNIKKSLFKKLQITKITEILKVLLQKGILPFEL